jgi:nitroreductase
MLQSIKARIPQPIKSVVNSLRGERVFAYDKRRFVKHYGGFATKGNSQAQLEGKITFFAHAIEKGLSRKTIRYHFGSVALENLAEAIRAYINSGFPLDGKAYLNGLSVLSEYINLHESKGLDVAGVNAIFGEGLVRNARNCNVDIGGVHKVHLRDKVDNREKTFRDIFVNRWSVREYEDSAVDMKRVEEAISIALKSPSICNRQSGRVYVFNNEKTIGDALAIQGGFSGYDLPPVLLMITTDTSSFISKNERNQVYTDGGLFAMSLLLSLEFVTLAACPLNAMLPVKGEKALRKLLDIPANENIIMFVSVGNFMDTSTVPKSFRFSAEEITKG